MSETCRFSLERCIYILYMFFTEFNQFRTFRNFYPTAIFVKQYPQKSKYFEICTYLK